MDPTAFLLYPLTDILVRTMLLHVALTVLPELTAPAVTSKVHPTRVLTFLAMSVAVVIADTR